MLTGHMMEEPTLYDTLTGDIRPIPYTTANGMTVIEWGLYDYDSLLFKLSPAAEGAAYAAPAAEKTDSRKHPNRCKAHHRYNKMVKRYCRRKIAGSAFAFRMLLM
jgi:hypothetical protein